MFIQQGEMEKDTKTKNIALPKVRDWRETQHSYSKPHISRPCRERRKTRGKKNKRQMEKVDLLSSLT